MSLFKSPVLLSGQLKSIFSFYPLAIISSFLLVAVNAFALWGIAPQQRVLFWLFASVVISCLRFQLYRNFTQKPDAYSANYWLWQHNLVVAISGAIWGYALVYLMPDQSLPHQFIMTMATAGLCAGASSSLSLSPFAYLMFLICSLVPMSLRLYYMDDDYGLLMFSLCYIYMYYMWVACQRNFESSYNNLQQAITLDAQEKQLQEAQQRVDMNFERNPLGIIEWDAEFNLTRWNSAAAEIFGWSLEELKAKPERIFQSEAERVNYFKTLAVADSFSTTVLISHKLSGEEVHCEWSSGPVFLSKGQLSGYTSFVRDVTQRLQREELITRQAYFDAVTALPNRIYFLDRLVEKISLANRTQQYGAVFFVDLDHFKNINDSMGHSVGDVLLQQFAQRLQSRLRECDTLARFGGDEFVILVDALDEDYEQSQLMAAQVARALQLLVQKPFALNDADYLMTCSIGITLFNSNKVDGDELLKQADLALYESKNKGRNNYTFFEQEMSHQASRHLELLNSLRGAIDRQEMALVFQPKVTVGDKHLMGAEVLLRWNSDRFGSVSPAEFIPILEGSSLISRFGHWVLEQSFEQLASWRQQGLWSTDMRLAVNISPKQLLELNFVEQVETLLARFDLDPRFLEFEITENVLVENTERVTEVLIELTELGLSFAIDDFGTGYSSLAYLKQLPIDVLKIDKSFIDHCTEEGNDQAIVRSILSICNELGLTSVAEGVESEGQRGLLQSMGCDLLQGYLFSRPLPAEEFIDLL